MQIHEIEGDLLLTDLCLLWQCSKCETLALRYDKSRHEVTPNCLNPESVFILYVLWGVCIFHWILLWCGKKCVFRI